MSLRDVQAGDGGVLGAAARVGLAALAFPFGVAARVRRALYDRGMLRARRVAVPVVSVGNLTAGGTGKTPLVAWLAARAIEAGRSPAILSRGYGHKPTGSRLSDEGTLLSEFLPPSVLLLEDPHRLRGVARLLAERPTTDLVFLDDGFQHRRLARDVDVVTVDATNPFGFERLLPRGLLREPPSSLARADVIVLTRAERVTADALTALRARVASLAPRALLASTRTRPRVLLSSSGDVKPLDSLRGTRVLAWSGIGNPAQFESTLSDLGAQIASAIRARDHHHLTHAHVARAQSAASAAGAAMIVVTRKDLVKLRPVLAAESTRGPLVPLYALDVDLDVFEGGDALLERTLRAGRS